MFLVTFVGLISSKICSLEGTRGFEISRIFCGDSKALEVAQECFTSEESCFLKLKNTFVSNAALDSILNSYLDRKCKKEPLDFKISANQAFEFDSKDSKLSILSIVSALKDSTVQFTFDQNSKGVYLDIEEERLMCNDELKKELKFWISQNHTVAVPLAKEYFRRHYKNIHEYVDYLDKLDEFSDSNEQKMIVAAALSKTLAPQIQEHPTKEDKKDVELLKEVFKNHIDPHCESFYYSSDTVFSVYLVRKLMRSKSFGFEKCQGREECIETIQKFTKNQCIADFIAGSVTGFRPLGKLERIFQRAAQRLDSDCSVLKNQSFFLSKMAEENIGNLGVCLNSHELCRQKVTEYGILSCTDSVVELLSKHECDLQKPNFEINDNVDVETVKKVSLQHKNPNCQKLLLSSLLGSFMVQAQNYISSKQIREEKYQATLKVSQIYQGLFDVKFTREMKTTIKGRHAFSENLINAFIFCNVKPIPNFNIFNPDEVQTVIEELKQKASKKPEECQEMYVEQFKVGAHVSAKQSVSCDSNGKMKSVKKQNLVSELLKTITLSLNKVNQKFKTVKLDPEGIICEERLFLN